jgi:hypothetical protein
VPRTVCCRLSRKLPYTVSNVKIVAGTYGNLLSLLVFVVR